MKESWFFIVNPVSGGGGGLSVWNEVQTRLNASGIAFNFAVSEYHTHTIQIASEHYSRGIRQFIGIGGDGTLNEMVNGIFKSSLINQNEPCTVGLLPVGTGNDWVRSQQEPLSLINLITKLTERKVLSSDVGLVSTNAAQRYFMNVAGVGLDGQVVHEIEKLSASGKKGKAVYLSGLIRALFTFSAPIVTIKTDILPTYTNKILLVAAAKGQYLGGGMHISPHVKPNSGKLDFTMVKKVPIWKVLPRLHHLFNGKIGQVPFVKKQMGKSLKIESEKPMLVQADGEFVGEASKVVFEIRPAAVRVLY